MVLQHNPNPARQREPGQPPRCDYFKRAARHLPPEDRPRCRVSAIFDGMCAWHCDFLYGRAWYALWNAGRDRLNNDLERAHVHAWAAADRCDPTSYREWIAGERR